MRNIKLLILILYVFCYSLSAATISDHIKEEKDCFAGTSIDKKDNSNERNNNEIICKKFSYIVDNLVVNGFYVYKKSHLESVPAIIFNRSGNGQFGKIGAQEVKSLMLPLARQGYFVIASQYRGTTEDAVNGIDEFGGKDINDVLFLIKIIDDIEFVNGEKIGIIGSSRGAMMSLLATKNSDRFSATVISSPPTDLMSEIKTSYGKKMEENVFLKRIPKYKKNKSKELKSRSAMYWVNQLDRSAPILIMHASDDDRISPINTLKFAEKLQESKIPYKLMMFESGGHSLNGQKKEMFFALTNWFDKYLK